MSLHSTPLSKPLITCKSSTTIITHTQPTARNQDPWLVYPLHTRHTTHDTPPLSPPFPQSPRKHLPQTRHEVKLYLDARPHRSPNRQGRCAAHAHTHTRTEHAETMGSVPPSTNSNRARALFVFPGYLGILTLVCLYAILTRNLGLGVPFLFF